ncbi:MAG: DUF892 family protein [Candidatus Acidiferrales bacterium]
MKDAALISAAQRVEHYEIAAYGMVRAFAELLGENEASSLLKQTLTEEKETDEKLTQLSQNINPQAMKSGLGMVDDDRVRPAHKTAKAGARDNPMTATEEKTGRRILTFQQGSSQCSSSF